MRAYKYSPPTGAELHRRWLELVDTDGPFLAVPPLRRVWPQGMPTMDPNAKAVLTEAKPTFEKAWETWDRNRGDDAALTRYRTARDAWVATVLRDVIGWQDSLTLDTTTGPLAGVTATSLDRTVTVAPTGALVHNGTAHAVLLVVDPADSLRDAVDDGWAASPIDRLEALLHVTQVPVGVVTDGRWWAMASAATDGGMTASGVVDSQTWVEEPDVRDAFVTLLSRQRLIGGSRRTGSPPCSLTRSPRRRRSPRRWACRCAARSSCSSPRFPRPRRRPAAPVNPTPSPRTGMRCTRLRSRS